MTVKSVSLIVNFICRLLKNIVRLLKNNLTIFKNNLTIFQNNLILFFNYLTIFFNILIILLNSRQKKLRVRLIDFGVPKTFFGPRHHFSAKPACRGAVSPPDYHRKRCGNDSFREYRGLERDFHAAKGSAWQKIAYFLSRTQIVMVKNNFLKFHVKYVYQL